MPKYTPSPFQPEFAFDEIPYGYCRCGCGQKTNISQKNHTRLGHVKGEPYRYAPKHGRRARVYPSLEVRFLNKVDKNGPIHPVLGTACWLWKGSCNPAGYGKLANEYAHRISYELHNGPVSDGLHVLHKCDRRNCNNPAHLFLGTQVDNVNDMVAKKRQRYGTNHPNSIATEQQVREARRLYADGLTHEVIGVRLGLAEGHVGKIVRRELWAHI